MAAGSGGTAGQKGGYADAVVVRHNHTLISKIQGNGAGSGEASGILYPSGWGTIQRWYTDTGIVTASDEGVDGTGKNLPPYITAHIWKRTK